MSEESVTDSTIDLKKRARRRLVGAAALALLAVIILPIVMDSEPKPSGQDIQIRIPSQDSTSVATRLIPGRLSAPLTPAVPDTSKAEPAAEPLAPKPADVAAKPVALPAVSSVAVEKPKVEEKPKIAATKSDAAKQTEAVHAEAALEGKDAQQWVVQLGAYQNAANVKQLTGKLKDMGLSSFTEKLDSAQGVRTRVRAGPFKSRDAAEKARLRIKKIGVDGSVVQK